MFLKFLSLQNFRNHDNLQLQFDSELVFLIGGNGEGKTNILEAIGIFSNLKSFRESSYDDIIGWGKEFFFIKSEFKTGEESNVLEIGYEKISQSKKRIKLNGEVIKKKVDIVGKLKSIIFSPADLRIIDGGQIHRRKFIDTFISFYDQEYLFNLLEYSKILKQRNALLKGKNFLRNEMELWDRNLSEKGYEIQKNRESQIQKLNVFFKQCLNKISAGIDNFEILYSPNVKNKEDFENRLRERLSVDVKLGYTTTGIHRDEIKLSGNGKDIQDTASQGQKRSTVLSLKTAVFKFFKFNSTISPILLIDDVIRELDVDRRKSFIELISDCGQVFFTTTDLDGIQDFVNGMNRQKQIFQVKNKRVMLI